MALTLTTVLALSLGTVFAQSSNPYAPVYVTCPSSSLLRQGGQNPDEASYVTRHKQAVASTWRTFYAANNHNAGYDLNQLFPNDTAVPTLGIACSGGGYRAALACAGLMTAFDLRNSSTPVGGVLQMSSYLSGLSGGSWAVGSFAINNFPNPTDLVLGNSGAGLEGWQLQYNLVTPGGLNVVEDGEFLDHITDTVETKKNANFNTSITDAWGRALSYHFAPGTTGDNFYDYDAQTNNHGANITWNMLTQGSLWQNASMPVPLVSTTSLPENMTLGDTPLSQSYAPITSPNYEFSPWEFGSHDSVLDSFVPVNYTGTRLVNGQPINSSACVQNFDNFGFVIGTSASLFNAILSTINSTLGSSSVTALQTVASAIGSDIRDAGDDVANYPNSFEGINPNNFERSNNATLDLTDGGEAGENIPLRSMLVPSRGLDVIIASDNSADTDYSWPNGTSLFATQLAGQVLKWNVTLPPLPANQSVIVQNGWNTRPIFFGCNASTQSNVSWPLVVYLPNAPTAASSYLTNTSTFKLEYDVSDASAFLDAQHANVAQSDTNLTSTWPVCLSCAMVERIRVRQGLNLSATCQQCFSDYCYGSPNLPIVTNTLEGEQAAVRSGAALSARTSLVGLAGAALFAFLMI